MNHYKAIQLPYPVSANRYWRVNKRFGSVYVSNEAKQYKQQVSLIAKINGVRPIQENQSVKLAIEISPKLTNKGLASKVCIDIDNACKVLLDALQGVCYENDKQVKSLAINYATPCLNGCVIVRCTEL